MLRHGVRLRTVRTPEQLQAALDYVESLGEQTESATEYPPTLNANCGYCDHRTNCPAYAAALAGVGITGLPSYVAEDALMEHALERVLCEWHLFSATLWATMPSRQHLPARTRAVLDFLLTIFGGEDRDPWLAAAGCETVRKI